MLIQSWIAKLFINLSSKNSLSLILFVCFHFNRVWLDNLFQMYFCWNADNLYSNIHSLHVKDIYRTNLRLSDKYSMIFLTGKVAFPLHGAIILAFRFIQYDTHPFSWGKKGCTNVGNSATLTLPGHLYYRTNLWQKGAQEDETWVACYWMTTLLPLLLFMHCVSVGTEPTFGGLLLSIALTLLTLLSRMLVSWRRKKNVNFTTSKELVRWRIENETKKTMSQLHGVEE